MNAFTFDEPYLYKGIKIYPIKLRDYFIFNYVVECLLIDKNSIPDAKVISMSYLDFLIETSTEENKNIDRLSALLYLVIDKNENEIKLYKDKGKNILEICGVFIDGKDFDNIKKIILDQNLIETPDYTIQKEIRDKIEEGKRIRGKSSKMADLEDQMISLSISTGLSLENIYNMSYRKFVKSISRADLLLHYKIYLQAQMSGMVSFKDTSFIKHWLTDTSEKGEDGLMALNDVTKKISFEDKKK